MSNYKKKVLPIPSSVLSQDWEVRDSQLPAVNIAEGKMAVPLSCEDRDLALRLHEMVHVKISPWSRSEVDVPKKYQQTLGAIEDFRVNTFASPEGYTEYIDSEGRSRAHQPDDVKEALVSMKKSIPQDIKVNGVKFALDDLIHVINSQKIEPIDKLRAIMSVGPITHTLMAFDIYLAATARGNLKALHDGKNIDPEKCRVPSINKLVAESPNSVPSEIFNIVTDGIDADLVVSKIRDACKQMFPASGMEEECYCTLADLQARLLYNEYTFPNVVDITKQFDTKMVKLRKENEKKEQQQAAMKEEMARAAKESGIKRDTDATTAELAQRGLEQLRDKLESEFGKSVRRRPQFRGDTNTPYKEAMAGVKLERKRIKLCNYKPAMISRKKRPEYVGAVPKHIERLPFDGQVFERRMRGKGGSLLIDLSGSMSLSNSEIDRIVKSAPAVLVAGYSATKYTNTGTLTVIAENGRMGDAREVKRLGYNIVDTLALEWLARQKPPRIWVSDGGITGKNHTYYKSVVERAIAICTMSNIIRVPSVGAAMKLFENQLTFTEQGRLATSKKLVYDPDNVL